MLKRALLRSYLKRAALALLLPAAIDGARASIAWGVEGHGYGPDISLDQQMALLQSLGATWYRVDCNSPSQFSYLQAVINAANAHGIKVLPVISDIGVNLATSTESYVYGQAYTFAQAMAQQFRGQISVYECGNEEEQGCMVQPGETMDNGQLWQSNWGSSPGDSIWDYIGTAYDPIRGLIRGLSDGFHATDSGCKTLVNTAGWFHYGFLQRLIMDGVNFDIVGWDWYSGMGNIENAAPNSAGVGTNIAAQLQLFGKPIWITEFNDTVGSQNSPTEQAAAVTSLAGKFASISGKYGIEVAMAYELADEPGKDNNGYEADMGLVSMNSDSSGNLTLGSPKPAYYALQDVIAGSAALADTAIGFSNSQGGNGWTYGYYDPANGFTLMPSFEIAGGPQTNSEPQWTNPAFPWLMITRSDQLPSSSGGKAIPVVRRWTNTYSGTIEIKGLFLAEQNGGDGVGVSLVIGGQSYFRKLIGTGQSSGSYSFDLKVSVSPGTPIDFVVDPGPGTNNSFDSTLISAAISSSP